VNTRDGRTVKLREIAVHEVRSGKIQNERFYYNPAGRSLAARAGERSGD
jgi:ketosteroid isomerase-like protein